MFRQSFVDFEQRRFVLVILPSEDDEGRAKSLTAMEDEAECIALDHIVNLPPEDMADHECLYCTAAYMCIKYIPFDKYNPPLRIETILRSHLVEVRRLKGGVDVCIRDIGTDKRLGSKNRLVFKYYYTGDRARGFWNEGVVGFTAPFMADGDLGRWCLSHPIKLKWLRQLVAAVDRLNLQHAVCHGDIAPRNVLFNRKDDEVYLIDFHLAAPMDRAVPERNDVKGVVLTVFEILTRDPRCDHGDLSRLNEDELVGVGRPAWVLDPMVSLDGNVTVDEIYAEVTGWASWRRIGAIDAVPGLNSRAIPWKPFPGLEYVMETPAVPKCKLLDERVDEDNVFCGELLDWTRPAFNNMQLPSGRRLLATGRYEDDAASPKKRACLGICIATVHRWSEGYLDEIPDVPSAANLPDKTIGTANKKATRPDLDRASATTADENPPRRHHPAPLGHDGKL
ncbi:hypothetical protein B0T18DRAFT_425493 [Schizothecium vesticola]|uniref:non-specific serine/threonine protein kinase n=1 Tax=Schizothecium vesticola TaxID=314040 RepID=A0AA40F3T9_9PEZI|nr:hypothetical protein B0T18DRAFT_425493 [Schizothecium vesticola]